ncbi:MAG: beta-lactamase family protein [Proteobacteria bacterium]|nr:beta-lactamase family protein [Pseudomonadota bacterium]
MKMLAKEKLALQVIDTWLNYRSRFSNLPGFQVCIRKKNQVIFSKAYGHANLITKQRLTTKDLFHIASHSKTFTSCAILQLSEQGKLALHQPALDYLPELKNHKDKRFKQVTIRDLLSNRSGIFRDGVDSEFWELYKPFLSREQLIQEVLSSDLIFPPNECSKYSNIGFSLLGLIIENILGMPYQNAMDALILKKLKKTHILADYSDKQKREFTDGHSRPLLENKRLPLKHAAAVALAPATGFCANAEDTSLFFETLLLGKGLLKKETQKELLSLNWPVKNTSNERYGLGLQFNKFSDMELVGHSGGYPGFATYTAHCVDTDYVISFFLNTNERIPLTITRSLIQILNKISSAFTDDDAKQAVIGGPLMNKWGSLLCVLTKKKGLCLPLEGWLPCNEALLLTSKNGEEFLCDNQSGYDNVGETIRFKKDKDGHILSAKWGSETFPLEKTFLTNFKKTLLPSR